MGTNTGDDGKKNRRNKRTTIETLWTESDERRNEIACGIERWTQSMVKHFHTDSVLDHDK